VSLGISRERHAPLRVNAHPASRIFRPTLPVAAIDAWRGELRLNRPTTLGWWGTELRADVALRMMSSEAGTVQRGFADLDVARPFGSARLVSRTLLAGAFSSASIPAQEMVFLGGPVSAPGYRFHSLVDDVGGAQRLELQFPVPFPALSLGRFGRSSASATLAPFVSAGGLRRSGFYPAIGVGALVLFDLIRLDVARGLRDPGATTWSIDVTRAFWSLL
jgi:hypothetical protein